MPKRDVGHLVRHHAGHLAFGLRRLDHAAIQEHRAAGQRERVDVFLVHDLEGARNSGVPELGRHRLTSLWPIRDVVVDAPVVEHRQFLLRLCRGLLGRA